MHGKSLPPFHVLAAIDPATREFNSVRKAKAN
jgi:hypothetical protein